MATTLVVPVSGLVVAPAAQSKQTIINGEVIRQDTTWSRAGSPYIVRKAIQIPHGVTLTVEPGVKVIGQGTEYLFRVGGTLEVKGSPTAPVTIEAGRRGSVIQHATTHDKPGRVVISYARLSNTRSIMPPGGNGMYIQFVLADSDIRQVRGYTHVWYPLAGSAIVRNTFAASGGLSVGMDARGPNDDSAVAPLRIEGNRFLTRSTSGYWIENWAAYGAPLPVHGNSFLAPGAPALRLPEGYDNSAIDARGNFWGTTRPVTIDRMIRDAQDDITRASVIEYQPILTSAPKGPPATTPTAPQTTTATATSSSSVQVSWTLPSDMGGRRPVTYVATASPGPGSCEVVGALTCVIQDLPSGSHTFSVTAMNVAGTSPASPPSESIVLEGSDPEPPPGGSLASVSLGPITMATRGRWVAPDGCGNYLFDFAGVGPDDIGTFALVDAASGKRLDSDITFGGLGSGTATFTVCDYQAKADTQLALELDFSGLGTARSATFAWETNPSPLPAPGSPPASVDLGPISVTSSGPWPRPTSGCHNYLFTYRGITSDDIGSVRLIDAVRRTVLDSDVFLGKVGNGTSSFTVCSYQVNSNTRLVLQADFSNRGVAESRNFEWARSAGPTPSVGTLPAVAIVGTSAASTGTRWPVPTKCGDYEYTFYGMAPDAIASVRIINATTREVLGSDVLIDPPTNGTGTIFLCPSDVGASTVARLQLDLSGAGLVESDAFRFGS